MATETNAYPDVAIPPGEYLAEDASIKSWAPFVTKVSERLKSW